MVGTDRLTVPVRNKDQSIFSHIKRHTMGSLSHGTNIERVASFCSINMEPFGSMVCQVADVAKCEHVVWLRWLPRQSTSRHRIRADEETIA
jgi:hypothetical protein